MNKILYADANHTIETGHDVVFKEQCIKLKNGRIIKKNNRKELYEMNMMPETAAYVHQHESMNERVKTFIQHVLHDSV